MKIQRKRVLRNLLLCALVPAAIGGLLTRSPIVLVDVFMVIFIFASVIGYPVYLLLLRNSWANAATATVVGLLLGVIPFAWSLWPLKYPELRTTASRGSGANLVYTMIDGVPTRAGWTDYLVLCAIGGMVGAIAGAIFWSLTKSGRTSKTTRPKA